jgi:hypothetical protein
MKTMRWCSTRRQNTSPNCTAHSSTEGWKQHRTFVKGVDYYNQVM